MYIKAINSTWNHKCKRVKCLLAHRLTRKKICTVTRQGTTVTILKPAWCLSRLNKIHNYCCFFPDQWRAWTVCVCVCVCLCVCMCVCVCVCIISFPCWCREMILYRTHTHTCTRRSAQILPFSLRVNVYSSSSSTKSLCHNALPSLPPFPSLPFLSLPLPPFSLPCPCHFYCMFQWLSVIKANYGLFWACSASCGSNTLLATRANPPLPPYV